MAKPLTLPSAATLPAVLLEQAARQGRRVALRHNHQPRANRAIQNSRRVMAIPCT